MPTHVLRLHCNVNPRCAHTAVYTLEWTAERVRVAVDNRTFFDFPNDGRGDAATWPFSQPFHLLLNVAVGA